MDGTSGLATFGYFSTLTLAEGIVLVLEMPSALTIRNLEQRSPVTG